jgi:putative FmdB family regulatory protein
MPIYEYACNHCHPRFELLLLCGVAVVCARSQ